MAFERPWSASASKKSGARLLEQSRRSRLMRDLQR
jgi:hypothetical protein